MTSNTLYELGNREGLDDVAYRLAGQDDLSQHWFYVGKTVDHYLGSVGRTPDRL